MQDAVTWSMDQEFAGSMRLLFSGTAQVLAMPFKDLLELKKELDAAKKQQAPEVPTLEACLNTIKGLSAEHAPVLQEKKLRIFHGVWSSDSVLVLPPGYVLGVKVETASVQHPLHAIRVQVMPLIQDALDNLCAVQAVAGDKVPQVFLESLRTRLNSTGGA